MTVVIVLFILSLGVVFIQGCDQASYGVGAALENIVNEPSTWIGSASNALSGKTWSDYKERTEEARARLSNDTHYQLCVRTGTTINEPIDGLAGNMTKVRDLYCSCKAWGTCTTENCSCDILCPENFEILNRGGQEMGPTDNEDFELRNSDASVGKYVPLASGGGLCWGLATMNSRFNHLAFFNPKTPKPTFEYPEDRAKFYKFLIEKVRRNQAVDIAGFASLKEFSSDSQIKELLAEAVGHEWSRLAIGVEGISSISSSSPLDAASAASLVADLKYRTENHQTPSLLFNNAGDSLSAHVVLVTEVKEVPDGTKSILCIKDNAQTAISNNHCGNKMIVDKATGEIIYLGKKVGFCKIAHNENNDVVAQVNSLRGRCLIEKGPACTRTLPRSNFDVPSGTF